MVIGEASPSLRVKMIFADNETPGIGMLVKTWVMRVCSSQGLRFKSR